ncbi:MAG: hypothetical protein QM803_01385 [Rhodocyclaceae bacterium]
MPLALRHTDLRIQADKVWLDALQSHAPDVRGLIVLIAPYLTRLRESRENYVAAAMRAAGYGTLIVSMLSPYEDARDPDVKYDVALLQRRLEAVLDWLDQQPSWSAMPRGILAVGTTAAACVRLLSRTPERASALACRAPRIDLAGAEPLRRLNVPTMMMIPGAQGDLRAPAEHAYAFIGAPKAWREFNEASAGFIEPGVLERASAAARDWFIEHLPEAPPVQIEAPIADQ